MNLEEFGRRVGAHAWWERRLFEVLGGWVAHMEDPAAKVMMDRHAAHAAWRSGEWWSRLPVMAGVDRDGLVTAPDPRAEAMVAEAATAGDDLARLAAAYRVLLPRLAARYHDHRRRAAAPADGAVLRTLGMVEADLSADWVQGEAFLQSRLRAPADAERVAGIVGRLESALTA